MQSAAALGLPLVAPQILAKPVAGANEKLNLAWVGFGNQGGGDLVWEARTLRELAARKGLVTQMGNQGHASEGARLIKEWYPKAKWNAYRASGDKQVPKTIPRTQGINRDWIDAIKNGTKSCSYFSYAGPLTETILLGTLAIRTRKTVKWNAEKLEIIGNPEAAKLINPEAREGWRTKDLV
jgi:hypothetical protein